MTNSGPKATSSSQTAPTSVRLVVRNLGHIPSKKNYRNSSPSGRVWTDKRVTQWLARCKSSFVSQLLSQCPTVGGATSTEALQQFLIASLPPDDNWKCIPEIVLTAKSCQAGEEGAEILIESL